MSLAHIEVVTSWSSGVGQHFLGTSVSAWWGGSDTGLELSPLIGWCGGKPLALLGWGLDEPQNLLKEIPSWDVWEAASVWSFGWAGWEVQTRNRGPQPIGMEVWSFVSTKWESKKPNAMQGTRGQGHGTSNLTVPVWRAAPGLSAQPWEEQAKSLDAVPAAQRLFHTSLPCKSFPTCGQGWPYSCLE